MSKVKKVDRPPVGTGVTRVVFCCRVDPSILKKAKSACKKKYKTGLSSKIEAFLINEFPEIQWMPKQ
jgi:hypothetical protein